MNRTKKCVLMVAVVMMTAMNVNAQRLRVGEHSSGMRLHEVAISYGIDSNSQIIDAFETIGSALVGAKLENDKFFGPISAEYFYHVKNWLGVGGILAYGVNKQDVMSGKEKIGESKNNYITLMPAVKFDWLRKKYFGMYSKLAVGATLRSEKYDSSKNSKNNNTDSEVHVNWQVSLLGIEAGSPALRGFAEIGTGEQGILLAGLRYKF